MKRKLVRMVLTALLTAALAGTACGAELYVVTGRLAPVFEKAGNAKNAPKGGWTKIDFDPPAVLAYGDTVSVNPAKDRKGWLSAVDEAGNVLGVVEASLLTPMPEYDEFEARPFQVKKDGAVPRLLPGKLPVSEYSGFSLPRGAVVMAEGRTEANGASWLLCSFGTDYAGLDDDDAEAAGSDRRMAWLAEDVLVDLSKSKPNLSGVDEANLPQSVKGDVKKYLLKNGFYVDPAPILPDPVLREDDMVDLYNGMSERTAKFITADLPLHVFHLLFDRALQKAEEKALAKRTADLIISMRDALKKQPRPKSDLEKKARANVSDFLDVALHLITNGGARLPKGIQEFADGVMSGSGAGENPFTELTQDFSLFGPRGHYTLNDDLKAYFRATYLLGTGWPLDSETGAAATLILNKLLAVPAVQKKWHSLYDPITALVGGANVNSPETFAKVLSPFTLSDLGKPDRLKALMEALDSAGKESAIQKLSGKKFAVLPRRITFDALIFHTLTAPDTPDRTLPDPLDVMAALGSKPAANEVRQYGKFDGYEANQKKLIEMWPSYTKSGDGRNVYTSILSFLRTYFASSGSRQFFANTPAWGYKKLTTAEGAMTELKHDTILYAEQSGAEMGEGADTLAAGPFKMPIPRSYIEPVPELFDALGESARKLAATLKPLLPDENEYVAEYYRTRMAEFADSMDILSAIAVRARDDAMTYDDFTTLLDFRMPSAMPEGIYEVYGEEGQDMLKMALVADVATDFVGGEVLYMATGTPRRLHVYVNDRSGGFRVTEGYMYSYYTFTQPALEKRVTDDDWKAEVYNPKAQEKLKGLLPYWHEKIYK